MDLVREISGDLDTPLLIDSGDMYEIVGVDGVSVTYVEKVQSRPINRHLIFNDDVGGWQPSDCPGRGYYKATGGNTVNAAICLAINDLFSGGRDITLVSTDKPFKVIGVHRDDIEYIAGVGGYHFFTIYTGQKLEVDYHFTIPDLTEADITAFTQATEDGSQTVIALLYDDDISLVSAIGAHIGGEYVMEIQATDEDVLTGTKFDAYETFTENPDLIFIFREVFVGGKLSYDTYFNPAPLLPSVGKHLDGWKIEC